MLCYVDVGNKKRPQSGEQACMDYELDERHNIDTDDQDADGLNPPSPPPSIVFEHEDVDSKLPGPLSSLRTTVHTSTAHSSSDTSGSRKVKQAIGSNRVFQPCDLILAHMYLTHT